METFIKSLANRVTIIFFFNIGSISFSFAIHSNQSFHRTVLLDTEQRTIKTDLFHIHPFPIQQCQCNLLRCPDMDTGTNTDTGIEDTTLHF